MTAKDFFAKKRKRKTKTNFFGKEKLLSSITLHLKVTKIVHRCKNFWIFSAKQRCGHTVQCAKTPQKYKYACRQFANKLPTVCCTMSTTETKKRPERGRLIYLFLRLCFSPSLSGFICFSTVGTTKTFLCNSETRACM